MLNINRYIDCTKNSGSHLII
uniref:Uncharacterized protein n=1 Tax=Anguilla anguilla TaxID=7936 RepID=A0A0E9TDA8_ANGAN